MNPYWFCKKCMPRAILNCSQHGTEKCEVCGKDIPPFRGVYVSIEEGTLEWLKVKHKKLSERDPAWLEYERKWILGGKA